MITKSVLLGVPPEAAFQLFTEKIDAWWPPDRRHSGDPMSTIRLLPDGRFYERARDGREVDLGRVIEWRAPERIVLSFYIATGPAHPTRAEIAFSPERGGTRVTVTHAATPESEQLWSERAPGYGRSWDVVLGALQDAADRS